MSPTSGYFLAISACLVQGWIVPQPKENVWVTLANVTGQDTICLSTATPQNPFSTRLVGLPLDLTELEQLCDQSVSGTPVCSNISRNDTREPWDAWWSRVGSPYANPPQELQLLGSLGAHRCVNFNYTGRGRSNDTVWEVTGNGILKNASKWCKRIDNVTQSFSSHMTLPPGLFLICGDRAWPAVPARIIGGPCTVGKLTLLTPNTTMIEAKRHHKARRHVRTFTEECDDKVTIWKPG
nr:uncharacterized protein LOC112988330 [Dromaius novaehollandiae]XP_025964555.1 uncharacterized protein LOC112988330 [Dromaius novaehollandiae]